MTEYSKAEEAKKVIYDLIENYRTDLKGINIEPVFRNSPILKKNKELWAKIYRLSGLFRFLLRVDFIIEIYKAAWDQFLDDGRDALIAHELKHIDVSYDNKGKRILSLIPHDFEEFIEIVERYGFWSTDLVFMKDKLFDKKRGGNEEEIKTKKVLKFNRKEKE